MDSFLSVGCYVLLLDTLWDEVKRFDYPHKYYVDLSDKLWDIQQHLLRSSQE